MATGQGSAAYSASTLRVMNPIRPRAVVFDVNETLVELAGLRVVFDELGLAPHALDWWFATLLRDGFALATTGDIASFASLAAVALDEVMAASDTATPPHALDSLLSAFRELRVHDDVAPALEYLAGAGISVAALTNGSSEVTAGLLDRAGLAHLVREVRSVDVVGLWKPRVEAYHYIAHVLDVEPERLALVAVHPWDLHGAGGAGLVTGWPNRRGRRYPNVFRPPTVSGTTILDVVEQLAILPD